MRKIVLLVACIATIASCKKTNPNNPVTPSTPSTPTTTYWSHFIPNWWNNDTMTAMLYGPGGSWTGKYDTIIAKSFKDTSYIVYKGKQYYIWTAALTQFDTFKTDETVYFSYIINDRLDTVNALIKQGTNLDQVYPSKYKDKLGNYKYQPQSLVFSDPNNCLNKNIFGTNFGAYSAIVTHH